MSNATAKAPSAAIQSFEAKAQQDGMLDADGFFTQDDWEFELDVLQDQSRAALEAHLAKGPVDHDTAVFLKGYLMNAREVKFVPFED